MEAGSFKQSEMAEGLGVSIDRVKSLSSGRVKKLSQDELRLLVEKFHVRPEFLATGEGAVFRSPEEDEVERRLQAIKASTMAVEAVESLAKRERILIRDILYGMAIKDSDMLEKAIESYVAERAATYQTSDKKARPKTTKRKQP